MHLHGFYYRVDGLTGPLVDLEGQGAPGRMVATERLSPFSAMSMSWSPDRPGNWILHCHFAIHLMPDSLSMSPDDPGMTGMVGLILGINVAQRPGIRLVGAPSPARRLRLVAIMDKGFPDSAASMRFVLEEQGRRTEAGTAFSPAINLTRGVPVSITVVNHLSAPTSVHWHGIELEDSYMDGVPGVTGAGKRLSPAIAPSDSFEARFTPPRVRNLHVSRARGRGAPAVRGFGRSARRARPGRRRITGRSCVLPQGVATRTERGDSARHQRRGRTRTPSSCTWAGRRDFDSSAFPA